MISAKAPEAASQQPDSPNYKFNFIKKNTRTEKKPKKNRSISWKLLDEFNWNCPQMVPYNLLHIRKFSNYETGIVSRV